MYDICKSEVGAVAALHLTGSPPYTINYELVQHGPHGARRSPRRKVINSSRDEIRLEPGPGEWEYRFTSIDDQFYKDVKLPIDKQYALRQKVQLVGDAQWKNARQKRVVHACEGETFAAQVELKVGLSVCPFIAIRPGTDMGHFVRAHPRGNSSTVSSDNQRWP